MTSRQTTVGRGPVTTEIVRSRSEGAHDYVYRGAWGVDGRIVWVQTPDGPRSLGVHDTSVGLYGWQEWGTDAAACATLAETILRDATGDAEVAFRMRKSFATLLANFPASGFAISRQEVKRWFQTRNGASRTSANDPAPGSA